MLFTAISVPPSWILVMRAKMSGTFVKWNTFFTRWTFPWKFLKVFGKWKVPIMSTLTQSYTLHACYTKPIQKQSEGWLKESGSLFESTKFIIPDVYSTGILYFGRLWSSFLKDKTKMLIANKVPAKHHWSPEACLQLCQGFHNMLLCISLLCSLLQKKVG